jgi:hypothetical protein
MSLVKWIRCVLALMTLDSTKGTADHSVSQDECAIIKNRATKAEIWPT